MASENLFQFLPSMLDTVMVHVGLAFGMSSRDDGVIAMIVSIPLIC